MQILDGKIVANAVKEQVIADAIVHKNANGHTPHLAAILLEMMAQAKHM